MEFSGTRLTLRKLLHRPSYRYMVANRIIPHIPWAILFILSIYLFKARVFADSGFYVSQFINREFFWIECQRIVLALSQLIPLIGVWLGFELRYVLLLYSVSHVIFFYFLFLLVYYGMRDRRSGLLILLFQVVGIMHSFYTPMFELYYGAPLLITFYAFWRLDIRSGTVLGVLLVLEVLILLSHPLAFMLFVFLLLYDYRRGTAKPWKWYLAAALVFAGAVIFKAFVMCDYETGKFSWQFSYGSNKQYLRLLDPGYYSVIGRFMLRYYSEVLLALLIVTAIFIKRREWFRLLLVYGTFAAYTFLVNSVYTLSPSRYMEQVMFPFIPIVFIPLIYEFRTKDLPGRQNVSVLLISALIIYRLGVIYFGSQIFTLRINQMENLIHAAWQKGGGKFIASPANMEKGFTQLNWSYPLETILLSSLDGTDRTVTIAPEEDLNFEGNYRKLKTNQFIFRKWEIRNDSWLNPKYFHLDRGTYKPLADSTPNNDLDYLGRNLEIKIHARPYYRTNDTVWMPVTVFNRAATPLHTGGRNNLSFSYLWIKNENEVTWNTISTPLDCDVVHSLTQYIRVAIPGTPGKFELKVDIRTGDGSWMGIKSGAEILVY